MPLIKSSSKAAVGENIRREKAAGKPQRQAVAIALDTARRNRAAGGRLGFADGGTPPMSPDWFSNLNNLLTQSVAQQQASQQQFAASQQPFLAAQHQAAQQQSQAVMDASQRAAAIRPNLMSIPFPYNTIIGGGQPHPQAGGPPGGGMGVPPPPSGPGGGMPPGGPLTSSTDGSWGGPGQFNSPLDAAMAARGLQPGGNYPVTQPTVGLAGTEFANLGMAPGSSPAGAGGMAGSPGGSSSLMSGYPYIPSAGDSFTGFTPPTPAVLPDYGGAPGTVGGMAAAPQSAAGAGLVPDAPAAAAPTAPSDMEALVASLAGADAPAAAAPEPTQGGFDQGGTVSQWQSNLGTNATQVQNQPQTQPQQSGNGQAWTPGSYFAPPAGAPNDPTGNYAAGLMGPPMPGNPGAAGALGGRNGRPALGDPSVGGYVAGNDPSITMSGHNGLPGMDDGSSTPYLNGATYAPHAWGTNKPVNVNGDGSSSPAPSTGDPTTPAAPPPVAPNGATFLQKFGGRLPYAAGGKTSGWAKWRLTHPNSAKAGGQQHFSGAIKSPVPGRTDKIPLTVKGGSYVLPAEHVSHLGQGNTQSGHAIIDKMFTVPKSAPYGVAAPKPPQGGMLKPHPFKAQKFADGGAPYDPDTGVAAPVSFDKNDPRFDKRSPNYSNKAFRDAQLWYPGPKFPTLNTNAFSQAVEGMPESANIEDRRNEPPMSDEQAQALRNKANGVNIMAAGGEHVLTPEQIIARLGDLDKGHDILDQWVQHEKKNQIKVLRKLPPPRTD